MNEPTCANRRKASDWLDTYLKSNTLSIVTAATLSHGYSHKEHLTTRWSTGKHSRLEEFNARGTIHSTFNPILNDEPLKYRNAVRMLDKPYASQLDLTDGEDTLLPTLEEGKPRMSRGRAQRNTHTLACEYGPLISYFSGSNLEQDARGRFMGSRRRQAINFELGLSSDQMKHALRNENVPSNVDLYLNSRATELDSLCATAKQVTYCEFESSPEDLQEYMYIKAHDNDIFSTLSTTVNSVECMADHSI